MNIEEMKQCLAEVNLVEQRIAKLVDRLGLVDGVTITDIRKNTRFFLQNEDSKVVEKGILASLAEDYCTLKQLYSKLGVRDTVQPLPSVLTFLENAAKSCIEFGFAVDCEDY